MKKIICILFSVGFTTSIYSQQIQKDRIKTSTTTANFQIEKDSSSIKSSQVIDELEKWDEKLNTLKSDFKQEVFFKEANIRQKVEGEIIYKKPNLLRIEHTSPSKQIIITDKVDIQVYKPEENQIYKMSWDYWKKTQNFSSLFDFGNYSELINKNEIKIEQSSNTIKVQFTNKEKPSLYEFTLFLSPKDFFPYQASLKVEDTYIFTELFNTEINGKIEDKTFQLEKTKKTEVIELKTK